jgi:hypothetical protein
LNAGGEGKQKQSYGEKLGFHACKDNKKNPFKNDDGPKDFTS